MGESFSRRTGNRTRLAQPIAELLLLLLTMKFTAARGGMTITGSGLTVHRLQTAAVAGDTDSLVAGLSAVPAILHVA